MCGREDRALQECNPSAWPPVDCGCIRPDIDLGVGILFFGGAAQTTVQSDKLIVIHILGRALDWLLAPDGD